MKNPSYLAVHVGNSTFATRKHPRDRMSLWSWTLLAALILAAGWMWRTML